MVPSLTLIGRQLRHSFSLDLNPMPMRCSRRDLNLHRSINSLNLNLTAKNSINHRDVLITGNVVIIPDKSRVLLDLQFYDQISRLTRILSSIALSSDSQILTSWDSSWNFNCLLLGSIGDALSLAGNAGICVGRAFSSTGRAAHLNLHWSLSEIDRSFALASFAFCRSRSWFALGALASWAFV